jgi:hypothetical protein
MCVSKFLFADDPATKNIMALRSCGDIWDENDRSRRRRVLQAPTADYTTPAYLRGCLQHLRMGAVCAQILLSERHSRPAPTACVSAIYSHHDSQFGSLRRAFPLVVRTSEAPCRSIEGSDLCI